MANSLKAQILTDKDLKIKREKQQNIIKRNQLEYIMESLDS